MVVCFSHADERLDIAVSDVAWSPRLDFPVDFCVVVEDRRREWVRTYVEPLSVMEDTYVTIACFSHIDGRLDIFRVEVEERRREWVRTYVEPLSVMEDTCVVSVTSMDVYTLRFLASCGALGSTRRGCGLSRGSGRVAARGRGLGRVR